MRHAFWVLLVMLVSQQPFGNASNILGLFPHNGYSHFKVFYPLLRGLAERGHNVTVVTHIKSRDRHANYHELLLTGMPTINAAPIGDFTPTRAPQVLLDEYYALHEEGQHACENFYRSGHVAEILRRHQSAPFELVIMEFFNTDCFFGVPHVLKVPVVGLSSCALMPWYYDLISLPDIPSYVQSEFIGFPAQMNWHQRLLNFAQAKANKLLYRYYTNYQDRQVIKKYLNIDVDVHELGKNLTSLLFVNQHFTLLGNRPSTAQLIEMGGIHIDEHEIQAPLPADISAFLEEAPEQGVLFISWGSQLLPSSLPQDKLDSILSAVRKLPYKIIWKWEKEETPVKSEQILFVQWAPQLALLCHPKVKLFWGHAGLLGTTEAVYCGKPMVLTPFYGDQFLNANAVSNRKAGLIVYYDDLKVNHLMEAFEKIQQPCYTANALSLSKLFRERETSPLKTSLWWIEFVLRHGDAGRQLLRSEDRHLNWFTYHSLDSLLILLGAALSIVWILKLTFKILLGCLIQRKRSTSSTKVKAN